MAALQCVIFDLAGSARALSIGVHIGMQITDKAEADARKRKQF